MNALSQNKQSGITIAGLIFVLAILGAIGVLALKIVPTVSEFMSIKKTIAFAKANSKSSVEARASFDKQAQVQYIESISGKDLEIANNGGDIDISFAYQRKIPLFGPASILLEYEGTTARVAPKKMIKE